MRFAKILLVCFGLVLLAGPQGKQSSAAASPADSVLRPAIFADGGDRLPLTVDGGRPLPPPSIVADGGRPLPPPLGASVEFGIAA